MKLYLNLKRLSKNFKTIPYERLNIKTGVCYFRDVYNFVIFKISYMFYEIFAFKVYYFVIFPQLITRFGSWSLVV